MPQLALRLDQLAAKRAQHGIGNDTDLANRMGVSPSQLSRVLAGSHAPGQRFVAGMVQLFGPGSFDQLFEIVPD